MNRNGKLSLQQGALGEAAVLKELIKQGYTIFTQFSGHSPFDLVAYKDSMLFRVSVKSTIVDEGYPSWRVNLYQGSHGKFTGFDKTSADILAVYIVPEDRVVLFDTNTITNIRSISIPKEDK